MSSCPKPVAGIEKNCWVKSTRVESDYENVMKFKLWLNLIQSEETSNKWKDRALRSFLRNLVCLDKWIFLQVPGPTYEMCIRGKYVAVPDPLDLVCVYKFL